MGKIIGFISKANLNDKLLSSLRTFQHQDITGTYNFYQHNSLYCGLSFIPMSHQEQTYPIQYSFGNYNILFDGVIYNNLELLDTLKAQGHIFLTESDAEILLYLFISEGITALKKINGNFSFSVHNHITNKLILARDAFGTKPIFYNHTPDTLLFSSDIRTIILLMGNKPKANIQQAYDYLIYGSHDSSSSSFIENIQQLQSGHYLEYDLNNQKISVCMQWWQPNIDHTSHISFEEATQKVQQLFFDSIQYNMRCKDPLCIALSGGIDSSSIVCAIRHLHPHTPIHTFSFIPDKASINEEKWIDSVNQYVAAKPHKVYLSYENIINQLDHLIIEQGEPFGGTSIYAEYNIFKAASLENFSVILDGQGADEIIAGNIGYPGYRLLSFFEQGNYFQAIKFAYTWAKHPGRKYLEPWRSLISLTLPNCLYKYISHKKIFASSSFSWFKADILKQHNVRFVKDRTILHKKNKGQRVREALCHALSKEGLAQQLRAGNRNASAAHISNRTPFLNVPLAEFLLSLPENFLISNNGQTKFIFREAMRKIVPDEHLDRYDKIGFATPQEWLSFLVDHMLHQADELPEIPFIDQSMFLKELTQIVSEKKTINHIIWRWINYIRWYNLLIQPSNNS